MYTKTVWADEVTPLSAANMNKIENMLEAVGSAPNDIENLKINALLTDLQLASNSANIDAWCDLLGNNSMLDTNYLKTYGIANVAGQLAVGTNPTNSVWANVSADNGLYFGSTINTVKVRLALNIPLAGKMTSIKIHLVKNATLSSSITWKLYQTEGTTLATGTILDSAIALTTGADVTIPIGVILPAGAIWLELSKTDGTFNSSARVKIGINEATSGSNVYNKVGGTTWTINAGYNTMQYVILYEYANQIIWNSVTASEVLSRIALVTNQTVGTGTITWSVSDDGTNWIPITNFKQMYDTGFDATSVYLKCVLTGNATVQAVAWGG